MDVIRNTKKIKKKKNKGFPYKSRVKKDDSDINFSKKSSQNGSIKE